MWVLGLITLFVLFALLDSIWCREWYRVPKSIGMVQFFRGFSVNFPLFREGDLVNCTTSRKTDYSKIVAVDMANSVITVRGLYWHEMIIVRIVSFWRRIFR